MSDKKEEEIPGKTKRVFVRHHLDTGETEAHLVEVPFAITQDHFGYHSKCQPIEEINITPAMIEAGVYAMREYCLGEPLGELARLVFVAMVTEMAMSGAPSPF